MEATQKKSNGLYDVVFPAISKALTWRGLLTHEEAEMAAERFLSVVDSSPTKAECWKKSVEACSEGLKVDQIAVGLGEDLAARAVRAWVVAISRPLDEMVLVTALTRLGVPIGPASRSGHNR